MNVSTIVKLNFLVVGFALCAYTIYSLKNDGMPQSLTEIVGLPSTQKTDYLTWCNTRASKLHLNENVSLFQKGTRWFRQVDGKEQAIDTIAMEKWFSQYCRISVNFLEAKPTTADFSEKLGIEFVNGVVAFFKKGPQEDTFQWQSKYFKSKNLENALKDLDKIAQH